MSHPNGHDEQVVGYRGVVYRGVLWPIVVVLPCMDSQARAHQMLALGAYMPGTLLMVDTLAAHSHLCYQFCWMCIYPGAQGQWPLPSPASE